MGLFDGVHAFLGRRDEASNSGVTGSNKPGACTAIKDKGADSACLSSGSLPVERLTPENAAILPPGLPKRLPY